MNPNLKDFPAIKRYHNGVVVEGQDKALQEALKWYEDFYKELYSYILFIDNARSQSPSNEMKTKYQVYKEILGDA